MKYIDCITAVRLIQFKLDRLKKHLNKIDISTEGAQGCDLNYDLMINNKEKMEAKLRELKDKMNATNRPVDRIRHNVFLSKYKRLHGVCIDRIFLHGNSRLGEYKAPREPHYVSGHYRRCANGTITYVSGHTRNY